MKNRKEYIYSAITSSGIGLFISLSVCSFLLNENLLLGFIPVWTFLGGTIIYFILGHIKPIANKKTLKYAIFGMLAVAIAISIRFL